jgi:putative ABC transport system permease protein
MLIKIAWRNIWRKKTRSLIIISAVTLGIWAIVFISGFEFGFVDQVFDDSINHYCSDIQIHNPDFSKNNEIQYQVAEPEKILQKLDQQPEVKASSARVVIMGMVSSPTAATGAKISGIMPEREKKLTAFNTFVKEGSYFGDGKPNSVLIGEKLATKLKVKLHSKIVITFADKKGNIQAGAFRVCGLYKTLNSKKDEMNVFVQASDINQILGADSGYHEIALLMKDHDKADTMAYKFKSQFPGLKVESWRQIAPELDFLNGSISSVLQVFIIVIMIGLAFAIINTMLMTVMERIRELGMLMAIGMNKKRTFLMIMFETITLSFIGCFPGLAIGSLTIWYFGSHGIDLSSFSKSLESYGMNPVIYTSIHTAMYYQVAISVFLTAVLSSIYPSFRAIRLKPAEAIRKI